MQPDPTAPSSFLRWLLASCSLLKHGFCEGRPKVFYRLGRGKPRYVHNLLELIEGGTAWKEGFPEEHFPKDTTYSPHVNALTVNCATQ